MRHRSSVADQHHRAPSVALVWVAHGACLVFLWCMVCSIASASSESSLIAATHPYFSGLMNIAGVIVGLVTLIYLGWTIRVALCAPLNEGDHHVSDPDK
jgi:hypothetical protein